VEHNGKRLGIDFGAIEAVVLMHDHWDHGPRPVAADRGTG
jgi:7,8-dihydropterin-6-yl-methyl-4-(beta-D-ribofuranosyl)aminobenzene 5'-phosphate synthase